MPLLQLIAQGACAVLGSEWDYKHVPALPNQESATTVVAKATQAAEARENLMLATGAGVLRRVVVGWWCAVLEGGMVELFQTR